MNNSEFTRLARGWLPRLPDDDKAMLIHSGTLRDALDRIDSLDAESKRFYYADGSYEILASSEEVKAKRIECAKRLEQSGIDQVGLTPEHYLLSEIAALDNPDVQSIIDRWVSDHEFLTGKTTPIRVLTTEYKRQ